MWIKFNYEADVSWLTPSERKKLKEELEDCTSPKTWDYFDLTAKKLSISGTYDDEDGYLSDAEDIELVLKSFDLDWTGKYEEDESEPDWDRMPGGYDYEFDMSLGR